MRIVIWHIFLRKRQRSAIFKRLFFSSCHYVKNHLNFKNTALLLANIELFFFVLTWREKEAFKIGTSLSFSQENVPYYYSQFVMLYVEKLRIVVWYIFSEDTTNPRWKTFDFVINVLGGSSICTCRKSRKNQNKYRNSTRPNRWATMDISQL